MSKLRAGHRVEQVFYGSQSSRKGIRGNRQSQPLNGSIVASTVDFLTLKSEIIQTSFDIGLAADCRISSRLLQELHNFMSHGLQQTFVDLLSYLGLA
jgi:hypothetical protein